MAVKKTTRKTPEKKPKKYCPKCNSTLAVSAFYLLKTKEPSDLCKKCETLLVDPFEESTFIYLLEKYDVPYVRQKWNTLRDRAYIKDPNKFNATAVFGKYLASMKIRPWTEYGWADTDKLQAEADADRKEYLDNHPEVVERERNLEIMFKKGEITNIQYQLMLSGELDDTVNATEQVLHLTNAVNQPKSKDENDFSALANANNALGGPNPYDEKKIDTFDDTFGVEVNEEERNQLQLKWGKYYKLSELIELEKFYADMAASFDIQDADTEGALKLICKTNLKMNQAIDMGDIESFNKLQRSYDAMRKSAKFTQAQNKEGKGDFVDCIGSLVAYCEKEGGKIPRWDISYPRDMIDETIMNLKKYTRELIDRDTSLAQQIEDFIKQKKAQDAAEADAAEALINGDGVVHISDEDLAEERERIAAEREGDEMIDS